MLKNVRRDAAKYASLGGWYSSPGFWIVAIYRLGVWGYSLPAVLRIPVLVVYRLARFPLRYIFNVDIWAGPRGARIGAGLCLIHPNNIIVGRGVEIGEDCLVFHEVTLGTGPLPGFPKIGNNVDIYVGARILGGITIGDRSMIGANCVVTRDVPPGSVVAPPPVRIIPRSLSPIATLADKQARAKSDAS
jgi:serine O-acetyltransferase